MRPTAALTLLALAAACSSTRHVKVPIVHPAEVPLSGTIAISGLSGDRGEEIRSLLEEKLLESGGRFQVIDRAHMGAVMNELKLSASDLAQSNNAVKLGKLVTAAAIISADIEDRYREQPRHHTVKDNKGRDHDITTWDGEANVRADFKIVEVSTGRLLLARSLESKKTWNGQAGGRALGAALGLQVQDGPRPDREKLERDARTEVVQKLVFTVAPRKEYGEVDFESDSAMPQLDGGIGWATRGEWKRAQDQFNEAIKAGENNAGISSKTLAKAYLDSGLSYVFAGDYDAGIKLIEKAYDLTQDTKMLDRVDYAKQLQTDAAKLATQAPADANTQ